MQSLRQQLIDKIAQRNAEAAALKERRDESYRAACANAIKYLASIGITEGEFEINFASSSESVEGDTLVVRAEVSPKGFELKRHHGPGTIIILADGSDVCNWNGSEANRAQMLQGLRDRLTDPDAWDPIEEPEPEPVVMESVLFAPQPKTPEQELTDALAKFIQSQLP